MNWNSMRGWKRSSRVRSLAACALVCVCPAGAAEPASEDALPEAFFEFLAEWEDEHGQWQDPTEYEGAQWQVLDQKAGQSDE